MKRFFAMLFVLVGVVFAWGCVGQPESIESTDTEAMDDDGSASEPDAEATFYFPIKCPPDSTYICDFETRRCYCILDDW